ncbi:hypothetical protein BD779DRAFT_1450513 [Infundibulicybe gibba]|nr:hypothetical protein BD779DRAFT_1450513 [Infundibulicybe gibba]
MVCIYGLLRCTKKCPTTFIPGQELQDLVKWLSPLDFSEKYNTAFEKHVPGTGEWFLEHPKFLAWMRGEFRTLWCPGGPGVGKSIMASLVIHKLGEAISEDTGLVFIYFEYKTKYTVTKAWADRTLLKALMNVQKTRQGYLSPFLSYRHQENNRPTFNELLDMLKVEMETYSHVLVVIDALDEIEIQVWAPLLRHLQILSRIRLLATSRNTGDIALELQPDQHLDITANEGDVRKYIQGRLSGSTGRFKRLLDVNMNLHEEIITGVMKKADGMCVAGPSLMIVVLNSMTYQSYRFLLARLHMNSLETRVGRVTDLRLALANLPRHLETTYDETLGRINDEDKSLAYQIFSWLIHAARPMTMHDLQYALAVDVE